MRYVDAGYAICLGVLFVYAVGLVLRRRRLERAAALVDPDAGPAAATTNGHPGVSGSSEGTR